MNIKVILSCLILCSCSMYEVVQEVGENQYHLHNKKKGKIEIIKTDETLEIGKTYNLKKIQKND